MAAKHHRKIANSQAQRQVRDLGKVTGYALDQMQTDLQSTRAVVDCLIQHLGCEKEVLALLTARFDPPPPAAPEGEAPAPQTETAND